MRDRESFEKCTHIFIGSGRLSANTGVIVALQFVALVRNDIWQNGNNNINQPSYNFFYLSW